MKDPALNLYTDPYLYTHTRVQIHIACIQTLHTQLNHGRELAYTVHVLHTTTQVAWGQEARSLLLCCPTCEENKRVEGLKRHMVDRIAAAEKYI